VGGVEADKHEFPSILNLGYHSCGAALIHPKWALTAAHCIPINQLVGGDHIINENEGTEQRIPVTRSIPHPRYQNPGSFSNDAALLELSRPFQLNEYVQLAKLAPRNFEAFGDAVVAGWGTTETGRLPDELHKVTVPLVDNAACEGSYGGQIDGSMICAGIAGKDSCQGDSGGPMFCNSTEGMVHCGIVSWGRGCGLAGYPGVYARTSEFHDFINQYVQWD
jgi:trypsin